MQLALNPDVLQWARMRAMYDIAVLAGKLKIKREKIEAWETTGILTLAHVERLAHVTHTPVGMLYLPERPIEKLPTRDFRTVAGEPVKQPSPDLIDVLDDAICRQDWYREYQLKNDEPALDFVGSMRIPAQINEAAILDAAGKIRSRIDFTTASRAHASSTDEAFKILANIFEDAGMLVMKNGIVGNSTRRSLNVEEFRGFALSDPYAPVIFINGKDSRSAMMFTLAHELVHIWLGASGVSILDYSYPVNLPVERFCNAVAAELLVPLDELKIEWNNVHVHDEPMKKLIRHFKVSIFVILRRLRDMGALTKEQFEAEWDEAKKNATGNKPQAAGGWNGLANIRIRASNRFTHALIGSVLDMQTPFRDGLQLLQIKKLETFKKLAEYFDYKTYGIFD